MTSLWYCSFVIIIVLLFGKGNGLIGTRFWKLRQQVEEQRYERAANIVRQREILQRYKGYKASPVTTDYLEQPLDHFNALSKVFGKTYHQRYYVNDEYWNKKDHSPVFLYIGGEGTLTSYDIQVGEIVDLAKQHGALLVAAEHRFYGASLNDDGLQLVELQYLSSQQALADLATFVHHIRSKFGIPVTSPWICFGGSYPGALSAWFRLKYPHLVHGAVASSAPVKPVTNFEGYNEVVAASLQSTLVGGSQECYDSVKKVFQNIDFMITTGQYEKLQQDFKSCGPISDRMDTVTFVSNLAGYFMGVVQYNNEIAGQNISHVCDVMLSTSDPYTNLVTLNSEFMVHAKEECTDNSYMNYTLQMMNTTVDKQARGPGIRQWTYQTCTQFGYYQTCDANTSCPFSRLMSLADSDLGICQKVFKIDPAYVYENVQFSIDYYGGNHTQQSRIIFVNGSIDPWHWLSILTNQTALGEYGVFIQGTAHCADLMPARESDPLSLQMARQEISSLVNQFLQEPYFKQQ